METVFKQIGDTHASAVALLEHTDHFQKEVEQEAGTLHQSISVLEKHWETLVQRGQEAAALAERLEKEAEAELTATDHVMTEALADLQNQLHHCLQRFGEAAQAAQALENEVQTLEAQVEPYLEQLKQRLEEEKAKISELREELLQALQERSAHFEQATTAALNRCSEEVTQRTEQLAHKVEGELLPHVNERAAAFVAHVEELLHQIEEQARHAAEQTSHNVEEVLHTVSGDIHAVVDGSLIHRGDELAHTIEEIAHLVDETIQLVHDICELLGEGVDASTVCLKTVVDTLKGLEELFNSVLG